MKSWACPCPRRPPWKWWKGTCSPAGRACRKGSWVSNPPYLTAEEMAHLQPETAREPAMALAAGPDGLDFYRALASRYKAALRPGGALVLEIGWQQRQAVAALLESAGWADIGPLHHGAAACRGLKRPKLQLTVVIPGICGIL